MATIRIITQEQVKALIDFKNVIQIIEESFIHYCSGQNKVFPVIREHIQKHRGIFGIKSGYLTEADTLGFKAGGFWIENKSRDVPTHQSVIVLFNPSTGQPICLMDGNHITILRTGAVGAIAAKYLAKQNSRKACIIGAGTQGRVQLLGLKTLFDIQEVKVFDKDYKLSLRFVESFKGYNFSLRAEKNAQCAVENADIIVTATPSEEAIVPKEWILPSVHINAIGADTIGKQELDPKIFEHAKVVVDCTKQCIVMGETQHAFHLGVINENSIHAELGEIIYGLKAGRESENEVTLFDATGLAFQDLAIADLVYKTALEDNIGHDLYI